jgi:hypothetical protein
MKTFVCLVALALVGAVPGFAQEPSATDPAKKSGRQKIAPTIVPNFTLPDLSAANNAYNLTDEEAKLDCKKLTGRVAIAILQLRRALVEPKTSALSRTLQTAATPFLAGTTRGINPDGDNARDLSRIRALNGQLTAKNCQPFDLDAELQPGATNSPRPIPKPKAATKPAATAAPTAASTR